jgi:hypothetical protein
VGVNTKSNSNRNGDLFPRAIRARPIETASDAGGKPGPFGMRFVGATRNATPNHSTMKANLQSLRGKMPANSPSRAYVGLNPSGIPSAVALPRPTAQPILVGDRQTLRALRAAEMAAWEAASSAVRKAQGEASQPTNSPAPRLPAPLRTGSDAWGIFLLAGCAAAGLFVGIQDLSSLFAGWGQVLNGIRLLLQ